MKRNFIISGIIAGAVIVMMYACSKENTTDKPVAKHEMTAYEIHINKTLNDFKKKMEFIRANPQLKSGESVPADSAVWLLEATINFSHAFPNEYYSEFKIDTLILTVNRNENGMVDMNELTAKYDEMKEAVADTYHNVAFEKKALAVVDLTETNITETEILIGVETITGNKNNEPPPDPGVNGPFVEGDDWWYGELLGHCDPHTPNSPDAAIKLYSAMNTYLSEKNAGLYFISPVSFIRKGGDDNVRRVDDTDPLDNNLDYYLYSIIEGDENINFDEDMLCLEWTEMNIHFNLMKYYIYYRIPGIILPAYYKPFELTTKIGYHENYGSGVTHYYQSFTFRFGIPIGYDEGEGPEEI
jgi:hypothetical protein